jgi:hypothetical protein
MMGNRTLTFGGPSGKAALVTIAFSLSVKNGLSLIDLLAAMRVVTLYTLGEGGL